MSSLENNQDRGITFTIQNTSDQSRFFLLFGKGNPHESLKITVNSTMSYNEFLKDFFAARCQIRLSSIYLRSQKLVEYIDHFYLHFINKGENGKNIINTFIPVLDPNQNLTTIIHIEGMLKSVYTGTTTVMFYVPPNDTVSLIFYAKDIIAADGSEIAFIDKYYRA